MLQQLNKFIVGVDSFDVTVAHETIRGNTTPESNNIWAIMHPSPISPTHTHIHTSVNNNYYKPLVNQGVQGTEDLHSIH